MDLDVLIVLAIIVVAIISTASKGKKLSNNRPGQGRPGQARPQRTVRPAPQAKPVASAKPVAQAKPTKPAAPVAPIAPTAAEPARPARQPSLQELLQELLQDAAPEKAPAPITKAQPAEGFSFADDKDCVGGSLPHDEAALHEGESGMFTEPARARKREPAAAAAIVAPQRGGFHPDAAEMRRAVVMSEILGRPKALRARGVR